MTFYTDMRDLASELITEFGQSVTFTRTTAGAYTPGTGVTTTSTTVRGKMFVELYGVGQVDGTTVLAGDMKGLFSGTTAPATGDTSPINGKTYRVEQVAPVNPAGTTVVYYDLQLRA